MLRSRKNVVRSGSKRGFTLVELLIVIVVIGVLSAMMMLSSTEAVSSARASNIISNMRNIKTAVLSWYTDNLDRVKLKGGDYKICPQDSTTASKYIGDIAKDSTTEITKYLNNDNSITLSNFDVAKSKNGAYFLFSAGDNNKNWYVGCNLGSDKSLQDKIAGRAKTLGLGYNTAKVYLGEYESGQQYVNMLIQTIQ